MKYIIHVGLPKCGSTFLQKIVFNNIKKSSYEYFEKLENEKKQILKHCKALREQKTVCRLVTEKKIFISKEQLVGFCPSYYKVYAEKNLKFFSKNSHIILVIRKPDEFLSSCYTSMITNNRIGKMPQYYFEINNHLNHGNKFFIKTFSLKDFNYQTLIDEYNSRFKKVTVIKFEHLFKSKNLNSILNPYNIFISNNLKKYKPINRSPGIFYIQGMLFMFKFFRLFSYILTNTFILKKLIENRYKGDVISKEDRITSIIIKFFLLDKILYFLSVNVFKKKFNIKKFNNNYFDLKQLEIEYNRLPELKHYTNNY